MLITCYVSKDVYEKFVRQAEQTGKSTGELAQILIRTYVNNPNDALVRVLNTLLWCEKQFVLVGNVDTVLSQEKIGGKVEGVSLDAPASRTNSLYLKSRR